MTSFLWCIYVLAIGTGCCTWWTTSFATATTHTMLAPSSGAAGGGGGGSGIGTQCGGTLTAERGVIQTPNFPQKFAVPVRCLWIIDASASTAVNVSIVVYFTQQYVLSGMTFTEYLYYSEDYQVKSHQSSSFEWNEDAVTQVAWVRFASPYLAIEFSMDNLYGTHLRALDRLLDVYGFNITYEVAPVKPFQCNALKCRFLGHCYAAQDYS